MKGAAGFMGEKKALYRTTTEIDFSEYQKLCNAVAGAHTRYWITFALFEFAILVIAYLYFRNGKTPIALIFVGCAVVFPLVFMLNQYRIQHKAYYSSKNVKNMTVDTTFYSDYLMTRTSGNETRLKYSEIYRILETKTNFYVLTAANQGTILVKKNCSPALIAFLRELKNEYGR